MHKNIYIQLTLIVTPRVQLGKVRKTDYGGGTT